MSLPKFPLTPTHVKNIAKCAGVIMKKHFKDFGISREVKSDTTPLTLADTETNEFVLKTVRNFCPDIDIKGEEGSDRRGSLWRVIFDPIDGTFPFTWGMPVSTFMLALIYDGEPVMSVIHDPFVGNDGRTYFAEKGKGCYLNDRLLRVSSVNTPQERPIIGYVSWPKSPFHILRVCQRLEEWGFTCINLASIGYVDVAVAAGEFVGVVFPGNNLRDTAAGHLIVQEAGGMATDLFGNPLDYHGEDVKGHIFSNGKVHDVLLDAVKACQ